LSREKLSLFFDHACVVSLNILLFYIPISAAAVESFLGFSLLFFLGRLCMRKGLFLEIFKRERIILLFFISLSLSLVNSDALLPISLRALFSKWAGHILLYVIIAETLISAPRIKCALVNISCGAALVILDCCSQLFFNFEFLRHKNMALHANNISALTGPFKHNNGLAAYLVCTLIVILYWVFSKSTKVVKSAAAAVFILGIYILCHTYSRGGWLIFIIAIILLAILLKKFRFLGLALLVTIILGLRVSFLKFLIFKDSGRFQLWDISLRMIKEHPLLGNGIGTFMALCGSFSPSKGISHAHNCFLELWAEAGLITVVIFVLFIAKTLHEGLLCYKKTKDHIFVILACAIIAYLCHSFFDTHLFSLQLAALFWVLMGLLKGSIASVGR
jgi:putative inorganic carbon (hco3(-)) transporter